jgi:hypothetical protein
MCENLITLKVFRQKIIYSLAITNATLRHTRTVPTLLNTSLKTAPSRSAMIMGLKSVQG